MYTDLNSPERVGQRVTRREQVQHGTAPGGEVSAMEMVNFFDHATDLIQVADQAGWLRFVNRAWARTLRYTPQEATRLSVGDMVHSESRAACLVL